MKYFNPKFYFSRFYFAKFYFAIPATVLLITMFTAPQADARNKVLTGKIKADIVCHDGANRGWSISLHLSTSHLYYDEESFFVHGPLKSYYDSTQCWDLREYGFRDGGKGFKDGQKITAYYSVPLVVEKQPCLSFSIIYTKGAGEVWVQSGGTWWNNITCVAKDSL